LTASEVGLFFFFGAVDLLIDNTIGIEVMFGVLNMPRYIFWLFNLIFRHFNNNNCHIITTNE
jgi:hypothetical protein